MYRFRSFGRNIFVCVTLIGVKSKYGSGWGTSPGIININDTPKKKVCARSINYYRFIWLKSINICANSINC